MFRRLFAIETAAIRNAVEQTVDRHDGQASSVVDSLRDLARPMAATFHYGLASTRVAA